MPGAHALLSPSGAKRWLACSRSVRYTENMEEDESEYAEEGSLAHDLAEWTILKELGRISDEKFKNEFLRIKKSKFFYKGMPDDVAPYVDYVLEQFAIAREADPEAEIYIEHKTDLSFWIPEGFGTTDVLIVTKEIIWVIDLKFGQGVAVSAVENPQLKIYALGAYTFHAKKYGVSALKVHMAIVQPRIKDVSATTMWTLPLVNWGYDVVKPGAKLAFAGGTEYVPGDHCQFCKARAICKTLAAYNLEAVDLEDFKEPNELGDEEIALVLQRGAIFRGWLKKVETYALSQALSGKQWPGMKVVRGRSNSDYADEFKIIEELSKAGVDVEDITKFNLIGKTELKREIGGKKYKQFVEPHLIKEDGAPTLVLESDERPAMQSRDEAAKDFGVWEDDEFSDFGEFEDPDDIL